jgi:hypothetical protein
VPPAAAWDVSWAAMLLPFIERQDIPRTFPAPEYQLTEVAEGYCGRSLYQVFKDGQSVLFISVAGLGVGNPASTGLVIIWNVDPRLG